MSKSPLRSRVRVTRARFDPSPGNRLRVLRAEARLTQYETAYHAKLPPNRYWRIEAGWTVPTEQDKAKIANVFKVSVADAFPAVTA